MKKSLFSKLSNFFNQVWYENHPVYWLLIPFSLVYRLISSVRRFFLQRFFRKRVPIPVIIVGNLTVGGVGKTPLVIAIAKQLVAKGLRVGIISRGYGAKQKKFPYLVQLNDSAEQVGDEPLLIATRTSCPVVISPKRVEAVHYLINHCQAQVVISDDGLQHYALDRTIEIVVIDNSRRLGNGYCLPAGPLREGKRRILQSDFIVLNGASENLNNSMFLSALMDETAWRFCAKNEIKQNGIKAITNKQDRHKIPATYTMSLEPGGVKHIITQQTVSQCSLSSPIAAVAGIGHPQRFFETLKQSGFTFVPYSFSDHYQFQAHDLEFKEKTIIMTEKDAVKCQPFAQESWYFLPIEAKLSDSFWQAFYKLLGSHEQFKGCH